MRIISLITFLIILFNIDLSFASSFDAKNFMKEISDSAFRTLNSNKADSLKQQELTKLFVHAVDIDWVGRFSIGRYWKDLNDEEKIEYSKNFRKFLIKQYVSRFKNYNNETYNIIKTISEENNKYIVFTTIKSASGNNIIANYKIHQTKSGDYKIYDVIVEGISLLNTHRSEFNSLLSEGNKKKFLTSLKDKVNSPSD